MKYDVIINGQAFQVELLSGDVSATGQQWLCRVNGRELRVDSAPLEPGVLSLLVDGCSYEFAREPAPSALDTGEFTLAWRGRRYAAEVHDPRALRSRRRRSGEAQGPRQLTAPMPGKVVRVIAPEGAQVEANDGVLVIEARKMQNEIRSPKAGVVKKLLAGEGAAVNAGDVLAIVE